MSRYYQMAFLGGELIGWKSTPIYISMYLQTQVSPSEVLYNIAPLRLQFSKNLEITRRDGVFHLPQHECKIDMQPLRKDSIIQELKLVPKGQDDIGDPFRIKEGLVEYQVVIMEPGKPVQDILSFKFWRLVSLCWGIHWIRRVIGLLLGRIVEENRALDISIY